jgi:hypothetical protein
MSWSDIEERLGTNWLNKIGTAVFVIGTALLLNYSMKYLGPAAKIALGYLLGAGMIATGVVGERRERYRIVARAVLGGGWGVTYFTTYAMHNVPAVRVVENVVAGFLLLFVVAAAMVWHSLRYNSEVVTGLAYLLGFTSVVVSPINVTTLAASALLAASLVAVLWRRGWYRLEPLAILAAYGVHWHWLRGVREIYGAHRPFPDFNASAVLLSVYWLIFTVSHFLRDDREPRQRYPLIASFLLNAGAYLAVLGYQSVDPRMRFWFLLVAGAAYAGLSVFSWKRGRRLAFLLTSTMGAALLLAAVPERFSGAWRELLWLVEAEALLYIGWRLADGHPRRLGWAGTGFLTAYILFRDLSPRLAIWRPPDVGQALLVLVIGAAWFLNARLAARAQDATPTEEALGKIAVPVSSGLVLAAAWLGLPFMWVAPVWMALGLAASELTRRAAPRALWGCGHAAVLIAAIRLLVVNLQFAPPLLGTNLRVLTLGVCAALLYFGGRRALFAPVAGETGAGLMAALARPERLAAAYSWAATALGALLIWNEVTNAAIALAWGLLGLALLEAARILADRPLVAQGYALLALSFVRIFFADLNAEASFGPVSQRLATVALLAAFYYSAAFTEKERGRAGILSAWCGSAALVALLRFELPLEWIAAGWAVLTAALYLAGARFAQPHLRYQAYLLTLFIGMRCAFDNFYQKWPMGWTTARVVTVVAASLPLYLLLGLTLREKRRRASPGPAEAGDD